VDGGVGRNHAQVSRPYSRNMSDAERWGSMAAGAALALYGLSRMRRHGWILAMFGALLFRRGTSGHCYTYELLGVSTADRSDMLTPHGDPLSHQLR
jgi:uncharacterized membrane protein